MNRATIPIGVMPGTKLVRVEWVEEKYTPPTTTNSGDRQGTYVVGGHWRLWTHHDTSVTNGTFFQLNNDGSMIRVVVRPDGSEDYFTVKGAG